MFREFVTDKESIFSDPIVAVILLLGYFGPKYLMYGENKSRIREFGMEVGRIYTIDIFAREFKLKRMFQYEYLVEANDQCGDVAYLYCVFRFRQYRYQVVRFWAMKNKC